MFIYTTGNQKGAVNWYVAAFLALQFILIGAVYGVELHDPSRIDQNVATIRMAGYCKAAITFVKYVP